jgi:catechol 2,3-dioxygenase-like lactoylglutathione lyase family enzyme
MTRKRTGQPWQTPAAYGRTLTGLTVNLIVRDVARSLPFYTDVLGFKALYGDADYAALEREGMRLQLHADHAYDGMPWAKELAAGGRRGLGTEIRLLGIDPAEAERAARARGDRVVIATQSTPHGWRECYLEDPDGYLFAVGVPTND